MVKKIVSFVIVWKLMIYFLVWITMPFIPLVPTFTPALRFKGFFSPFVWMWANFDGQHYLEIAERGYQSYEQAFFPLYPLLIALIHRLSHMPLLISGLLISHVALLSALVMIFYILRLDHYQNLFNQVMIVMLIFPTSFFYSSVYNDSLFLFLSLGCIFFVRKKKWIFSSICASLATLARLNGLALMAIIIIEYFITDINKSLIHQWNIKKLFHSVKTQLNLHRINKSSIYSVLLIPLVFIGYLLYVQFDGGSFLLLFKTMEIWSQGHLTFPPQVFWRYGKILILHSPSHLTYWIAFIELFFVLVYLFLLFFSFKKIRLSYWFFFALSILIPWLTGSFAGMPRYGLHIYPLFLSAVLFLERRTFITKIASMFISFILYIILLMLFTKGYFVA